MPGPRTATTAPSGDRDERVGRDEVLSHVFLFAGPVAAFVVALLAGR